MRDSIKIKRNFESLSLRFVSRCFRTATAFLIRCQRSSGIEGARPAQPSSQNVLCERQRRRTVRLEDTEDFVTRDETHLGDAVRVTQGNTNLRRRETLARELNDVLDDIVGRRFQPRWRGTAVWKGRGRYIESASERVT